MSNHSVDTLATEMKTLSLQDKAQLKRLLDSMLLEDRKQLIYSDYQETIIQLSQTGSDRTSDIAIFNSALSDF
ncbi:MAG: hypothetical protein ABI444_09795 [Candidatus Kapaibacterium sp.]|jgi:hypothetical protein